MTLTHTTPAYSALDPQANRPAVAITSVPVPRGSHPQDKVKLDEAIAAVVAVFGITRRDLIGRARPEWVIRGRLALYRLAWIHVGCSQAELGRMLGKNCATIRLGMVAALNRIETDPKYRALYEAALDRLDAKDQ